MYLEKGVKLVMTGDSITDCGRQRPVGEGLFGAHGNGYVNFAAALLGSAYPDRWIRVVNMGVSGDTVRELKARWKTDVLDLKPDWLSVMIGINDVWRQFDSPHMRERHVSLEEYRTTLEDLIEAVKPQLKGLILMTPYVIEPSSKDPMRAMMDLYGREVKKLSEKYGAVFVDIQAAFDQVLKHYHPTFLAWDRIHPNAIGHMVIARAFLNAIGFEWDSRVL